MRKKKALVKINFKSKNFSGVRIIEEKKAPAFLKELRKLQVDHLNYIDSYLTIEIKKL
jgi:hypothetical protein